MPLKMVWLSLQVIVLALLVYNAQSQSRYPDYFPELNK